MPVPIQCPECGSRAEVPEAFLGKTIRCKSCQTAFAAKATPPAKVSRAAVVEDDDAPVAKVRRRPVAVIEDDEDDAPVAKVRRGPTPVAKSKSKLPLIGGLLALLLVAAGGAAAFLMPGKKDDAKPTPAVEVAKATAPAPDAAAEAPVKTDIKEQPKTTKQTNPAQAPGTTGGTAPETIVPKQLPTKAPSTAGEAAQKLPDMNKARPNDTELKRAINAAVYIECESGSGGGGSGSGWFGVEENLIFTNAHVVDMLGPNASKPKKLTVYINPGTPKERKIEHAKLDLIAVDRFADLACIKVLNEKDLPTPLELRMSETLRQLENLVVLGYPRGRAFSGDKSGKTAPQVNVVSTTHSTNRNDGDGNLYDVQFRGGATYGNSGGPLIDVNGTVVGVVVRITGDIRSDAIINYAVPTEFVNGMLAGRVLEVEYGQAFKRSGKVVIPVTCVVIDPFNRLKEVGVAGWVADRDAKKRPPGSVRTGDEPSDSDYKETKLTYKWTKEKQTATGEIEIPEGAEGRVYFAQPYYTNSYTPKFYMAGKKVEMDGAPVELESADLVMRYKPGTSRPVTVSNENDFEELNENEGTDLKNRKILKTEVKATEVVRGVPAPTDELALQLVLKYESLALKYQLGGEEVDLVKKKIFPKGFVTAMNEQIKLVQGLANVRKDGLITKTASDLRGTPGFAAFFKLFSNETMESLQGVSVALPNRRVDPNYSWSGGDKLVRFQIGFVVPEGLAPPDKDDKDDDEEKPDTAQRGTAPTKKPKVRIKTYNYTESITYTYLGTRTRAGTKEAVVKIAGNLKSAPGAVVGRGTTGFVKGYAYVDLDTGVLRESSIVREFELDSTEDGQKKSIAGVNRYKVVRGPTNG